MMNALKQKVTESVKPFMHKGILLFMAALYTLSVSAQQKNVTVKGKVTDESGKPLSGVSVTVKGSGSGKSTDTAGNFSISVPAGSVISFSSIGYAVNSAKVGDKDSDLGIKLVSSTKELDQVVVVGYGTQKKKDVTGSVTLVTAKALKEVPSSNFQNALQGHAPGVDIQTVGTAPGSGAVIRIRGIRSVLGSNAPLVVVDGIPYGGNLNDINTDDIASLNILKDASATAIYGSRGSNGVILITTKRGSAGLARVDYNGYYGIGTVANKYPVFNGPEYIAMHNIAAPAGTGFQPNELKNIAAGKSYDWQDMMYQNSVKTNHYITVSGGNEGSTYSLGGGYYKETAVLPGQDYQRGSLRLSIDSKVGKWLRVGVNTMNSYSLQNGAQFVSGGTMYPTLATSPLVSPYDSTGAIVFNAMGQGNPNDIAGNYSPLLLKNNNGMWADKKRIIHTFNSFFAEANIWKGLKYRFNLGLDFSQEEDDQFQASDHYNGSTNPATDPNPSFFRPQNGNHAVVNNISTWSYTAENLLMYDKDFGKSRISATGLYSIQQQQTHNTYVSKDSMYSDQTQYFDMSQSSPTPVAIVSGGEASSTIISYMGRVNYTYDNKYMLTVTYRNDGSSVLATGHNWHQFAAASAGWNIMNENFIKNNTKLGWISQLKLRAGYGQTASQAVGAYSSLGSVTNNNGLANLGGDMSKSTIVKYNYGQSVVVGYYLAGLPNPNLDWEYTNTLNIGLDYGFLNNRITGSIDYYSAVTNKLLFSQNLPTSSGVSNPYPVNIGQMKNWGMEFSISSLNIKPAKADGFSWTTDLNLFFNRNTLTKQLGTTTQNIGNQLFTGYSMTSIYDYNKLGIWQTSEAAQAAKYGASPGQIKIQDYNGDGQITTADRHIIGNGDPKIQGGMTNTFTYKGFDLSVNMYGRFGGLLVSQIHQWQSSYLTALGSGSNLGRNSIKVDYWTPNNPTNWFPTIANGTNGWSSASTAWQTLGYYNASFLQIKAINIGYTLKDKFLKPLGVHSLRVYATVDNIGFLFSPYMRQTGIAPIATNQGSSGVSSPDNLRAGQNAMTTISAATPLTRNYMFGVNVNF
ncbi:SusC/RagA family TonB-linked outer membrane protein [Chitinophagaceae bacterium LWZ2-11]